MPGFTPNRNYPYPLSSDPADAPGQLQALAEAINDDLATVEAQVQERPFAQVRATVPQSLPSVGVQTTVVFDYQDFDNDDMANLSDTPGALTINTPGIYFVFLQVQWPHRSKFSTTAVVGVQFDQFLRQNGTDRGRNTTQNSRWSGPSSPVPLDGYYSTGALMNCVAGDQLTATVAHNYAATPVVQILSAELSALRVAN